MDENGMVQFEGDSDGVLTKGLVALLVRYVYRDDYFCVKHFQERINS